MWPKSLVEETTKQTPQKITTKTNSKCFTDARLLFQICALQQWETNFAVLSDVICGAGMMSLCRWTGKFNLFFHIFVTSMGISTLRPFLHLISAPKTFFWHFFYRGIRAFFVVFNQKFINLWYRKSFIWKTVC